MQSSSSARPRTGRSIADVMAVSQQPRPISYAKIEVALDEKSTPRGNLTIVQAPRGVTKWRASATCGRGFLGERFLDCFYY